MNQHSRKKFRKAYALITAAIDEGQFDESRWLPSIDSLARSAEVSGFTIWEVMKALKKEGRIAGEPGHRYSLPVHLAYGPQKRLKVTEPARRSRSRALELQIQKDILNGVYGAHAPLSASKELAGRYGVCRLTLRKALRALAQDSRVIQQGSCFFPSSISTGLSPAMSHIVLLGYGSHIGNSVTWGYWHQEYLKSLELECAHAHIALDVVCFARNGTGGIETIDGRTSAPVQFDRNPDVLGYVFEAAGAEAQDDLFLETIARWERPVAILDEIGTWPSPAFLRRHPNVRVFRNTISNQPARTVARFLFEQGHRAAVYISPHHQLEYSIQRFQGLHQAFADMENAQITAVTSNESGDGIAHGKAQSRYDSIMAFYDNWIQKMPRPYQVVMGNHFAQLPALCALGRINEYLERLLVKALDIRDATAWIVVNDSCAKYVMDFLWRQRMSVPGTISVVSFDDQPEALAQGITSYNFNQAATMPAILRYIANPRLYPAREPVIIIEGKLIPRRTTGKARH